jgi:hypothetical protein
MNAAPAQCHCCQCEIENVEFIAQFLGVRFPVCADCAEGITNGLEVLKREGVTGEYLGKCPDNE